jgi:hypothetical protein
MAKTNWKPNSVFSLLLRKDIWAYGQMLNSPYLVFFQMFSAKKDRSSEAFRVAKPLFFCATVKQILKEPIEVMDWSPRNDMSPPDHWIKSHPGSRNVKYWVGTKDEVEFLSMEEKPGGILVQKSILPNSTGDRTVVKKIGVSEKSVIDSHELDVIWTPGLLRERLFVCHLAGKNIDPLKDIKFDREPNLLSRDFIHLMAQKKTPKDLGY